MGSGFEVRARIIVMRTLLETMADCVKKARSIVFGTRLRDGLRALSQVWQKRTPAPGVEVTSSC